MKYNRLDNGSDFYKAKITNNDIKYRQGGLEVEPDEYERMSLEGNTDMGLREIENVNQIKY